LATVLDLARFSADHPEWCGPGANSVRGLGAPPPITGARELSLTAEALQSFEVAVPKDPNALPNMLKRGAEAVGWYLSFRREPERWGIYLHEPGVRALKEEYHRIIWRDLGKYADQNVDDIASRIEYSLVLDYLLTHAGFHYKVDHAAAQLELESGFPKYGPYLERSAAESARRPATPKDVVNPEEALANLEAFRIYINPTYGEAIAKLVEGRIESRNFQEWQAFFIGGRFAVEMANALTRQPPGWRDFTKFLNRKTSVGAYNYVRVQYSYNPDLRDAAMKDLSSQLAGMPPPDPSSAPNLLAVDPPPSRVFLYA